ncbi:MAG: enoyl-CoA hydratase-related protein [bacterium]
MAGTDFTLYEVRDGAAWITLNRPESRNALSAGLVNEMYDHLEAADTDDGVRCIVITGNGPAFCAGADLKSPPGSIVDGRKPISYPDVLTKILDSRKPVIAAINGAAFAGGLGLVSAADIAIAVEDAKMAFTEVQIGVIPAIISVVCLRKLGPHHGMRLFLTGERFSGKEAVTYGMAHKAVPADQLLATVQAEIDAVKLGGPNALAEAKKLVRTVPGLSIAEGFKLTAEWSFRLFQSEEGTEGIASFREKRKPSWVSGVGKADKESPGKS